MLAEPDGDDVVPEADPIRYRHGVRIMSEDALRQSVLVGGLLYVIVAAANLQVLLVASSRLRNPTGSFGVTMFVLLIGAILVASARWMPEPAFEDLYSRVGAGLVFFSSAFITVALWINGAEIAIVGTSVYLIPAIFAFYGLSRRLAVLFLVTTLAEYACLLAIQPDVPVRLGQFLFMASLMTAVGFLIGGFVGQTDELAIAEHQARLDLAEVNRTLEARVQEQVNELAHYENLRRFLAPQVADAVLSSGTEGLLEPHRREIAVFFSDLRGFTNFAGRVEPEEVLDVLNAYYAAVGEVMRDFEATLGHFAGDGVMAYFNDPVPCDDPAGTAVTMALQLRDRFEDMAVDWARRGYRLGYGMGIGLGHATLGIIGFEGRSDYTPLGTVVNLAARLCAEAEHGQILVDHRVHAALADTHEVAAVEDLVLKGLPPDVRAFQVLRVAS